MIFNAGGSYNDVSNSVMQIKIAVSYDLYNWTRLPDFPVFSDFCDTRDPNIRLEEDGTWTVFYCRCNDLTHLIDGVAYRTSTDLIHFSEP